MEDLQMKYDSLCYATFLNIKHLAKGSTRLNFKNVVRTNEEHLFVLAIANACRGVLEDRDIGVDCGFGDRLKLSKILNCPVKKINKNENIQKIKIEKEIEILEENRNSKEKEIETLKKELINKNNINLEEIKNKYKNNINEKDLINLFNKKTIEINNEIDYISKIFNNKRIELNTINIEEKNINEKLDKKLECEERIEYLKEKIEELHSLERSINIAKETLEEAYTEVKNEITPKFTKDLSLLIEKISNGKYKKANFDADKGLIVEREDGEYINCNNLSTGTIDQLYLSLRLSAMNEISEEDMPIILDESFAFYDNERLKNILKFISDNYKGKQIIIFTCSNREKEILDELNVGYNFVEL